MNTLPIIAGSQIELDAFLRATPWLNAEHVTRVTEPEHLQWRAGLVLALPGWELAPAIRKPRDLLAMVARRNMQLVVLEHAAYDLTIQPAPCRDRLAELELAERFASECG